MLAAPLKIWQGGKNAPRIVYHHSNVVFLWVAPQPPCDGLKDPKYAMYKRVQKQSMGYIWVDVNKPNLVNMNEKNVLNMTIF